MVAAIPDRIGLLLAMALGAAALAGRPPALAQVPPGPQTSQTAPAEQPRATREEVVVTAEADRALTARVVQVLQQDPYSYSDHISVETRDGVVILRGIALDLNDLDRMLRLAQRIAGKRRVVNQIELIPMDSDADQD